MHWQRIHAVFEVAVLGVPDEMMGEKVGAVIVPKPQTNARRRRRSTGVRTRAAGRFQAAAIRRHPTRGVAAKSRRQDSQKAPAPGSRLVDGDSLTRLR